MKVVSLNVNGLRAFDEKNNGNFDNFCLNVLKADMVCLQEVKGCRSSLAKYHSLRNYQTFSSFYKKGRHGVSTLVKKDLFCNKVEEIVPGRVLKTYHGNFVLYNCYMPYCDEMEGRDKSEIIAVYDSLRLDFPKENTIICGDFNATYNMLDHYQFVAELRTLIDINQWMEHTELVSRFDHNFFNNCKSQENIDHKNLAPERAKKIEMWKLICENEAEFPSLSPTPCRIKKIKPRKTELPYHFFDIQELERYFYEVYQRVWMRKLLDEYIDTFRLFHSELAMYTCWNTIFKLRPINLGTRIDYILCSKDMKCTGSKIMPGIMGSDHCPVYAEFHIELCEETGLNLAKRKNNLFSFFS